jgi:hypothetical protein
LLIHASFTVTADVPVLLTVTATQLLDPAGPKAMFVICICSVFVNVNVSAPIHAATAMLTATVTAMSMIDATTGLRAVTFFLIFIFPLSLLLGLFGYLEEPAHLNLTTPYTILVICKTTIQQEQAEQLAPKLAN